MAIRLFISYMSDQMTQFYSYLWLRKDGSPYYAGKGCNQRAFRQGKHYQNPPKDRSRILIFPQLSEADAFESEIELIKLFGRKDNGTGCLRNMTDGGEGLAGHKHSEETKKKMRDAAVIQKLNGRKYVVSPEHAAQISKTATGRKRGPMPLWWVAKLKAAAKVRAARPEEKMRMAANLTARREKDFIKTVAWG